MVRFAPFVGSYVKADFVRRVPAPAFDSMSGKERVRYLETHPESYTHVTRSPGDGGPEDDASQERLTELSAEALDRIIAAQAFVDLEREAFFLYRLASNGHSQIGVVGLIETADYLLGNVKRHEQVRHERVMHLSQHFEQLGVQSSPIAVGYRSDRAIRSRLDSILSSSEPVLSFTSDDGLEQEVWVVDDVDDCRGLTAAFKPHDLYILDGHHRAAAAGALAERVGDPRGRYMLGVAFADDRVNIDPFHRRVTVGPEADLEAVGQELTERLGLQPGPEFAEEIPRGHGDVGVFLGGRWWRGKLPAASSDSPLDSIDPVRLQNQVIGPVLGVDPEASSGQIRYFLDGVDRHRVTASLSDREILFVLREVSPVEVFSVADAGLDMPPKSTYITPKPRSGVFLRRF